MEYKDNTEILDNMKIEIKEENLWQDETAAELPHNTKFSFEKVPLMAVKQESALEVEAEGEDLLSESSRLTSEGVSQDGNGTCTSLTHSESGGHGQTGKVISDFKTTKVSAGRRRYKCDRCKKSFKQKSTLDQHVPIHSDVKPHKCDKCEKSFKTKIYLQRHIRSHSDTRPYKCDMCDKYFKTKAVLDGHILFHLGTGPYKCNICKKSFRTNHNLQLHHALHSDLKPFKCDRCDRCYKLKHSLERHVLLHSRIRKYKCDRCEESFRWNHGLQQHILLHSDIKP